MFSIFTGGIVFSSSSDLLFNPALPLAIGTISGFFAVILHSISRRNMGVIDTYGTTITYMIPGIFACIVSAVVHASDPFGIVYTEGAKTVTYNVNRDTARTNFEQGGYQIAGGAISVGIAFVCGVIVGIFYRCLNKNKAQHQFIDESYYEQIEK